MPERGKSSLLFFHCQAWYGSLRLIPGPTWKWSWNNLLQYHVYTCHKKISTNNIMRIDHK
jgi:hypothetical protein